MSSETNVLMVYITAANDAEAQTLASLLVQHKLAACVNILGPIQSVYEWKGKLESATEVAMVAKTTGERFPELEKTVREHHSYENPCIVAWPLTHGHGPFFDWVKTQTS